MGRFRNGVPAYLQEIALSKDVPTLAGDLKVSLEVDGKYVGTQWLHCPTGSPHWFLDRSKFRWDVLARTLELIEALNDVAGGTVTDVRFESATPKMPQAAVPHAPAEGSPLAPQGPEGSEVGD